MIVLETTTYSGTPDELVVAELESVGLTLDQDFFACFSPERVDPGNALFQTRNIPKVVGGVSELSTKLGVTFYQQVLEKVHPVSSARVAEMPNCWKIRFAPSTLAWSMNWRCWRNGWV